MDIALGTSDPRLLRGLARCRSRTEEVRGLGRGALRQRKCDCKTRGSQPQDNEQCHGKLRWCGQHPRSRRSKREGWGVRCAHTSLTPVARWFFRSRTPERLRESGSPAGTPSAGLRASGGCPPPADSCSRSTHRCERPPARKAGGRRASHAFMRDREGCGERKVSGGGTPKGPGTSARDTRAQTLYEALTS